jgi:hypothetical protein
VKKLILLLLALSCAVMTVEPVALAQSDEDLEMLEAEPFDDEFADEDFTDIEAEFEDIDGGEISLDEGDAGGDEDIALDLGGEETVGGDDEFSLDEEVTLDGEEEVIGGEPELPAEEPMEQPAMEMPQDPMAPMNDEIAGQEEAAVIADQVINDPPDEAFEARLHEIFEKYNKIPITNEQWAEIAGDRRKEIYDVVGGDSLWGISEMFFGDGFFWPKVWSFNSRITNPHVIEIGDRIMFSPGDEENPPRVVVEPQEPVEEEVYVEEEVLAEQVPAEPEVFYDESGGVIEIPQPTKRFVPVLKNVPPSIPQEQPKFYGGFDASGFAVSAKRFSRSETADMQLTSFVTEQYPNGLGEVKEILGGRNAANLHENVYVQISGGTVDDRYTVISKARVGADDDDGVEFDTGFAVDYQGEVELQEVVNEDINLYRALVVALVNPITLGATVVEGSIPTVTISNLGQASSVQAKIIGGEFSVGRRVLGVGSVAYLNAGANVGLQPDMIVGVIANERGRNEETLIKKNLREIGRIKIAKVEDRVATGIVVHATEEISTNDFVGPTVTALSEDADGGDFDVEDDGAFEDEFADGDFGGDEEGGDFDLGDDGGGDEFADDGDFTDDLAEDLDDKDSSGDDFGEEFAAGPGTEDEDFGGFEDDFEDSSGGDDELGDDDFEL